MSPVRFRIKGTGVYVKPMATASAYEAAGRGPRLMRWTPPSAGPNTLLSGSLDTLRARSRDAVRQMGYADAAVETLVANIVGTGIKPQFTTADAAFNKVLAEAFLQWTDESDADQRFDFYGQQALAVRSMIEGGDCFTRLRVRRLEDGLSVPLQLQVLEAEYCPEAKTVAGTVRCGVAFDAIGRRVGYWLHKSHPNDGPNFGTINLSDLTLVPATEIAHLALTHRPGMIRGEPWLTRALVKLHDTDKYDDAQVVRQQIAALFTGFVTEDLKEAEGEEEDVFGATPIGDGEYALASLEPGTMQRLEPGTRIEWSKPPEPGNDYEAFMRQQMRGVATSVGILYEQLTGDYGQINDRTFRAAVNEFRRRCAMWQHHIVVFQWCRPVLRRWAELAVLSGRVTPPRGIGVAEIAAAKWVPQGWAYIHPVQDVQSKQLEIRTGLRSRREVVSADGYDVEAVDTEIAGDNARADALGVVFDSDPRKTTAAGASAGQADETETVPQT